MNPLLSAAQEGIQMVEEQKHTPGPWRTNCYESPTTGLITVFARPFGLGDVAKVRGEANARLIAAAPDLLDVADLVLQLADVHMPPQLVAAASAAVQKATLSKAGA